MVAQWRSLPSRLGLALLLVTERRMNRPCPARTTLPEGHLNQLAREDPGPPPFRHRNVAAV